MTNESKDGGKSTRDSKYPQDDLCSNVREITLGELVDVENVTNEGCAAKDEHDQFSEGKAALEIFRAFHD